MKEYLKAMRKKMPLVHFLTNYVTVNDVANMMLASGGSPIMSDDIHEVEDITSICDATVINIGTLNERTIGSMIVAGRKANALGHPVIFDPVGAGASSYRTETTFRLLQEVQFSVIRGNISEIKTVNFGNGSTKGVDADIADAVTEENLSETIAFAKKLSKKSKAVIVITGAIDVIANEEQAYVVRNGVADMAKITGTGCMLDGVIAGCVAATPTKALEATVTAVAAFGLCGELAAERTSKMGGGTSMLRSGLIDAMCHLDEDVFMAGKKAEFM